MLTAIDLLASPAASRLDHGSEVLRPRVIKSSPVAQKEAPIGSTDVEQADHVALYLLRRSKREKCGRDVPGDTW